MTDRPILFSGPMVRALLDGRKTQTRRVLADSHVCDDISSESAEDLELRGWVGFSNGEALGAARVRFAVGDRLWVRETWTARMTHGWTIANARSRMFDEEILYAADAVDGIDGWWPSIHMPREFSRLTLTVSDVRVQRLQDISEDDAIAEGIEKDHAVGMPGVWGWHDYLRGDDIAKRHFGCPRESYRTLWDSLNAKRGFGWNVNPWIVALTFDVARRNIDAAEA